MGTSAFEPVVLADVRSVKNKISISGITSDVLSVGDVVRYDPNSDTYLRARADSATNATFVGVVESISATDMILVYSGEITLPESIFTTITGATAAQVFYLSDTNAGKLTATPPTNPGSVIKPVIVVSGTLDDDSPSPLGDIEGVVINSMGQTIAGDSTVDLSDIQPVGTISAFGGNTGSIPSGWEICDGGFLGVTGNYADLYSALNDGKIYGFIQNGTLTKTAGSGTQVITSGNLVGSKFVVNRSGFQGMECTVLSGTVSADGTSVTNAEIFINPVHVSGSLFGEYHNSQLQTGDIARLYVQAGSEFVPVDAIYTITGTPTKTKFKKPDMRARFVVGDSRGYTGAENSAFSTYKLGNVGGEEYHTLSTSEMPRHGHDLELDLDISGSVGVTHNLVTTERSGHIHPNAYLNDTAVINLDFNLGGTDRGLAYIPGQQLPVTVPVAGAHNHNIVGNIYVSANDLTPVLSGYTLGQQGENLPHNNVPQHMVLIWIIKSRKDSYAKILKLGPSGGGAVIAKNTARRWARMSNPGAGCTVDISYGLWGVSRLGTGNYEFYHGISSELGTADANKYIVEVSVTKTNGTSQILVANTYGYNGNTFGVRIHDVIGNTWSDTFDYLNLTMYGGNTAL